MVVLAIAAMGARRADAETRDLATAESSFRQGRALMKKGDFSAACAWLTDSLRLDPAVGTLMNLAECEARTGHMLSAWQHWTAAANQLPARDRRRTTALRRVGALRKQLAWLTVDAPEALPSGIEIKRDGVDLGARDLGVSMPVDPGIHSITVTAPDRDRRLLELILAEGERKIVALEALVPPPSAPPAPPSPLAPPPMTVAAADGVAAARVSPERAEETGPRRRPFLGYTLLAGGTAAVGGSVYLLLRTLVAVQAADGTCPQSGAQVVDASCAADKGAALDRQRQSGLLSVFGLTAGALAARAGLSLLHRNARQPRPPSPATTALLIPQTNGGSVQIAGTF
jgi:hypothetical protein